MCVIDETPVRPYVVHEKFLVFVFLSVCGPTEVAEIIRFTSNLAQMFMYFAKLAHSFWCTLPKSNVCRETQKFLNTLYGLHGKKIQKRYIFIAETFPHL